MDTRYVTPSADPGFEDPPQSPLTVAHVARTIRAYRSVIGLTLLAVIVGYVILAVAYYLMAPAVRVTSLKFRLEFTGAERGVYPNGAKFSSADIISTPVLLKTFRQNNMERFTQLASFDNSIYVVESNEAREALALEYQARLADQRLNPIDRERIQRDYELKAGSLAKNHFAISYARKRNDSVPDELAKKILHDILKNWTDYALNEQHVLEYRTSVLSPDIVAPNTQSTENPIVSTVVLRGKVKQLLENVDQVRKVPNAELMRTADGYSLNDIAVRLADVVRYRLEPLVDRIAAARLDDRAETLRFMTTQLAYDERTLQARISTAEAAQRTLAVYTAEQQRDQSGRVAATATQPDGEAVTTQINESFIDRLIDLTSRSVDSDFRKEMAEEFQKATLAILPAEEAVAYDKAVLTSVRNTGAASGANAQDVAREIASSRDEVRQLAFKVQEMYKIISRNLNASTELLAPGMPQTHIERGVSPVRLVLFGVLFTLLSLVLTVLLALVHSRIAASMKDAPDPA
ncbi:MAG TPA: hypothetical protein VFP80_15170 [Thermoanaerobaculia bacterium]|nr:hypothetical protein [Thermoanaerobaculia bacterium]